MWSQSLSATTHTQQLQATPATAEQAAVASEMTRAENVAAGRAELKKAEEDAQENPPAEKAEDEAPKTEENPAPAEPAAPASPAKDEQ